MIRLVPWTKRSDRSRRAWPPHHPPGIRSKYSQAWYPGAEESIFRGRHETAWNGHETVMKRSWNGQKQTGREKGTGGTKEKLAAEYGNCIWRKPRPETTGSTVQERGRSAVTSCWTTSARPSQRMTRPVEWHEPSARVCLALCLFSWNTQPSQQLGRQQNHRRQLATSMPPPSQRDERQTKRQQNEHRHYTKSASCLISNAAVGWARRSSP